MDERRALVAVVLIFLLLFGFMYWQNLQRPAPTPEQGAVSESGESAPTPPKQEPGIEPAEGEATADAAPESGFAGDATARGAVSEEGATGTPGAGAEERYTTVETPLWVATISNRGASISSWELREYDNADSLPVPMVPEGARGIVPTIGYGTTVVETGDWIFDREGPERITLEDSGETAVLRYSAEGEDGLGVIAEYEFRADTYAFDVRVEVSGLEDPTARRELWVEWPGVERTEEREDPKAASSVLRVDGGVAKDGLGRFKEARENPHVGVIDWVTSQSRYFMAALAPEGVAFSEVRTFGSRETGTVGFRAAVPLEGERASVTLHAFAGPQDYKRLSAMGVGLERAIDMGWRLTRPLSVLLLRALVWAHDYIPNYGVVIIIFSILTKLLFYRLTHKSFTEMKRMQDLQPKLNALKEKYGDDREGLAKAQMELYKKEGVNPLGSCLPMLFQMPVFIALFQVLRTTIELRGATFALWITDLSQPDTIAAIAGFPIHVLPLLMGAGMLLQQRFSSQDPSQAGFAKMMPILFTVLFYNFASGLVIYWLVNTLLSIGQQYYIHRGPSTVGELPPDAAAPEGVRVDAPASVTAAPTFDAEEAEVVSSSDPKPAQSKKKGKKRGRRRRKKK